MKDERKEIEFIIELLSSKHNRASFSCGNIHLDNYLKTQSSQDVRKNIAAVFVITPNNRTIAGFYTLSQYSVQLDVIPKEIARKLTKHPSIPATLLGRLAIHTEFKGKRLGEMALMDALYRSLQGSRQMASWAVIVDAKDIHAISFYKKYGFIEIPNIPNRLFMPMETIERMFAIER